MHAGKEGRAPHIAFHLSDTSWGHPTVWLNSDTTSLGMASDLPAEGSHLQAAILHLFFWRPIDCFLQYYPWDQLIFKRLTDSKQHFTVSSAGLSSQDVTSEQAGIRDAGGRRRIPFLSCTFRPNLSAFSLEALQTQISDCLRRSRCNHWWQLAASPLPSTEVRGWLWNFL